MESEPAITGQLLAPVKPKGPGRAATQFKPGAEWRGNARGRLNGARNRFSEEYVSDFLDVWRTHGKKAIKQLATKRPADFVRIGAMILSKQTDFNQDQEAAGGFLEVIKYLGRAAQPRD